MDIRVIPNMHKAWMTHSLNFTEDVYMTGLVALWIDIILLIYIDDKGRRVEQGRILNQIISLN